MFKIALEEGLRLRCVLSLIETKDLSISGIRLRISNYHQTDGYCYTTFNPAHPAYGILRVIDTILYCLQIALPMPMILISCVTSVILLKRPGNDANLTADMHLNHRTKSRATQTILILTVCHLSCNLPMLANYVCWTITSQVYSWPGPIYSNNFMMYYSWCLSDVACLALNGVINPVVFMTRIQAFRKWMHRRITLIKPG